MYRRSIEIYRYLIFVSVESLKTMPDIKVISMLGVVRLCIYRTCPIKFCYKPTSG
jgi:hypothetical protein